MEKLKKSIKQTKRKIKKLSPKDPNRKPGGITKEVHISDELAEVIGLPKGSMTNRPTVNKRLKVVFEERNLTSPNKNREILIEKDPQLKQLLGPPIHLFNRKQPEAGYGYNWTNLQTYLKPHFLKDTPPIVEETPSPPIEVQKTKKVVKKAKTVSKTK